MEGVTNIRGDWTAGKNELLIGRNTERNRRIRKKNTFQSIGLGKKKSYARLDGKKFTDVREDRAQNPDTLAESRPGGRPTEQEPTWQLLPGLC